MSVTDYNARLYEKMKAEQDKYRGWLLHQEPSEILNHTYEYIVGHNDGNVYPNGLISRAETATVFFRLLKDEVRDGNLLTSNTYSDVPDDYWANTAISTMTGLGIVQGHSGTTFDPEAPITRAQFAAICARFDTGAGGTTQTFSDISGHWAEEYIRRVAGLGWIKGFEDGTFRPDAYITRAQAMTMINRVLNRIPKENSDLPAGMNTWPDCNPGDWFSPAVQEATNSHAFQYKTGNYETWTICILGKRTYIINRIGIQSRQHGSKLFIRCLPLICHRRRTSRIPAETLRYDFSTSAVLQCSTKFLLQ